MFSPQLPQKLESFSTNESATPIRQEKFLTPKFPARSVDISFDQRIEKNQKITFPARSKLSDDRARGHVLHFFANHELLALELMALALLRWPDAPDNFRQGIVQVMLEEQNHMRLYLGRMKDFRVSFGEMPLNSFFWKCMKDLSSPVEFAAAMSMTFEQANLDFALQFEKLFAEEGDKISAEIMKRVHLEEIGHVKHGYVWFERWRPKCERLFKEWQSMLHFPMTPARAKGALFDYEGRRLAGLPEEFIAELEVHNQSKGRPPKVFWFNPGCEQEVEAIGMNWTPPKPIQQLSQDYASLMGFLAHESDVVIVPTEPTVTFLQSLAEMGVEIPEFLPESKFNELKLRKFNSFEPWGWSHRSRSYFKPLQDRLIFPEQSFDQTFSDAHQSIFSKNVAARIREQFECDPVATAKVSRLEDIDSTIAHLSQQTKSGTVVFKAPFSSAGRGMLRIRNAQISEKDRTWIANVIQKHGLILAEPWLNKFFDLSAHIDISSTGEIKFVGFTRFWTDVRGQYRGHIVGRMLDDLGPDVLKNWHASGGWKSTLQDVVLRTGREAFKMGYSGPLGIDAFVYFDRGQMTLRPLLEINPRWSMGRVSLAIGQRLAAKHCGLWIHISANDLKALDLGSFQELVNLLSEKWPKKISSLAGAKFIHQGIFPTNDPMLAKQSLSLLLVGNSLEECYNALKLGGIHDPQLELQSQTSRDLHLQTSLT